MQPFVAVTGLLVTGEGGGWSPAAAGGGHGRCMGKSRPVARRRRLCLREADCGEGGVWSRATQKVGPGRIDGKDMYPLVSGSFKLEYADTSRIRIRCVSGAYPYRIRLRHGIRAYPGVSV